MIVVIGSEGPSSVDLSSHAENVGEARMIEKRPNKAESQG
jgi:hypothetical protein